MKSEARLVLLAILLTQSLGLLAKKLVMGGAAGFFLELMLFIGFKYKLNMTTHTVRPRKPLHLAYSAYYKSTQQINIPLWYSSGSCMMRYRCVWCRISVLQLLWMCIRLFRTFSYQFSMSSETLGMCMLYQNRTTDMIQVRRTAGLYLTNCSSNDTEDQYHVTREFELCDSGYNWWVSLLGLKHWCSLVPRPLSDTRMVWGRDYINISGQEERQKADSPVVTAITKFKFSGHVVLIFCILTVAVGQIQTCKLSDVPES